MLTGVVQRPLFNQEPRFWSVSELNRYLRQQLESDYRLQELWVTGEVSNLSRPSSGHLYFTLKDAAASLRCVMWKSEVLQQSALPREGDAVEVHGHISVYEAGGQYQLYADQIRLAGEGDLYAAYLELKSRLEAEGLFDPERKRPLPYWPKRIGVVTSPTGSALQDVLNVLRRRFPLAEVVLSPTPVQGEGASARIIAALEAANRMGQPDVILLVRGGGSIEDLWAFNDEDLARAVAASSTPVVTGVGHETDFTIADFVADLRAPTPSAAAELASPDREEVLEGLRALRSELMRSFEERLQRQAWRLERQRSALQLASPVAQVANARQRLDEMARRGVLAVRHDLALRHAAVEGLSQTLSAVGPSEVLSRGYAVVTKLEDGSLVRSVDQVEEGDALRVRVSDGTFSAEVGDSGSGRDSGA